MFGGTTNAYDDIVVKCTSENLTSENWELILELCDRISGKSTKEDRESEAQQALAALTRRLTHRNPNVQLYTLSVVEAISKNCGVEGAVEVRSKAFVTTLERLIEDRTTNPKVKKRTLESVGMWVKMMDDPGSELEEAGGSGLLGDLARDLRSKNMTLSPPPSPPPMEADDEARRQEEEELQRVLELSMQETRGSGGGYTSSYGGGEGSSSSAAATNSYSDQGGSRAAAYSSGYTPSQPTPSSSSFSDQQVHSPIQSTQRNSLEVESPKTPMADILANPMGLVMRVRALHTFESTEKGELGFEKGDIIKVVDRNYKDWWRGQIRGRTGIFPVNYVEPMPDPTPEEMESEWKEEVGVFKEGVTLERLLTLLRNYDPKQRGVQGGFGDDEEIQELYREAMTLRPKIVRLIDKYSQKRADLVSMNETFIRARTIFEQMMEESLAQTPGYTGPANQYGKPAVGAVATGPGYGQPQPYGGAPPGYPLPQPQGPQPGPYPGYGAQPLPGAQPQPAVAPAPYGQPQQGPAPYSQQTQPQPYGAAPYPTPSAGPVQVSQTPAQQPPQAQPSQAQPVRQPTQPVQAATPAPTAAETQLRPHITGGPPYAFVKNASYSDPNVQAWADYYSKGGKDTAGAVYFLGVEGVSDPPAAAPAPVVQQPARQQTQATVNGQGPAQATPVQTQPTQQPQQAVSPALQQTPVQQVVTSPVQQQAPTPAFPTAQPHSPGQAQPQAQSQVQPGQPAREPSLPLPYPGESESRQSTLPYPGDSQQQPQGGVDRQPSLPYPGDNLSARPQQQQQPQRQPSLPYPGGNESAQHQRQPSLPYPGGNESSQPQHQQPQRQPSLPYPGGNESAQPQQQQPQRQPSLPYPGENLPVRQNSFPYPGSNNTNGPSSTSGPPNPYTGGIAPAILRPGSSGGAPAALQPGGGSMAGSSPYSKQGIYGGISLNDGPTQRAGSPAQAPRVGTPQQPQSSPQQQHQQLQPAPYGGYGGPPRAQSPPANQQRVASPAYSGAAGQSPPKSAGRYGGVSLSDGPPRSSSPVVSSIPPRQATPVSPKLNKTLPSSPPPAAGDDLPVFGGGNGGPPKIGGGPSSESVSDIAGSPSIPPVAAAGPSSTLGVPSGSATSAPPGSEGASGLGRNPTWVLPKMSPKPRGPKLNFGAKAVEEGNGADEMR
ncbi:hypothetical protein DL96DRAFT_1606821 [Flagelloscypha sp. PMI_526]|nr:hypothetical protein DL96DRAFT_1606821 [Flagelloscypha sp. PMI_526]